jgi:hypothetical protein
VPARFEPLGHECSLVAVPKHTLPPFELNPQRKPSDAERARAVDAALQKFGIGRR